MRIMNPFLLLLPAVIIPAASAQACEAPDKGCSYGMFHFEKCLCECIQPFCPDANGDCILPTDNCGGNPWKDCSRGVDCPWWASLTSGGECGTGSEIPPGVWDIYNDREMCCSANFPNAPDCNLKGPNGPLNIVTVREDVALDLTLTKMPDDIDQEKLRSTTMDILKLILVRLREDVPDLKVADIYERTCRVRKLDHQPRLLRMVERELKDEYVCYTVEILTDGSRDYEQLIITAVMASLLGELRDKLNIDSEGIDLNLGLNQSENDKVEVDSNITLTTTTTIQGGGLPGWGIALIVIMFLILACCIAYCIFAAVRDSREDKDTVIMFNSYPLGRSANTGKGNPPRSNPYPPKRMHRSEPPPRRRRSFAQRGKALRNPLARRGNRSSNARDRPRRRDDGRGRGRPNRYDNFRRSFSDMAKRARSPRRSSRRDTARPSVSFSDDPEEHSVGSFKIDVDNVKDPPMSNALALYEPNYAKPDPEGETAGAIVLALTNGEDNMRRYEEEPNTRPKLEPEETFDGSVPIPVRAPDPSVSGQEMIGVSGDDFGEESSDDEGEEEYDQYAFTRDHTQIYAPKRRSNKVEELEESLSFVTEDPEELKRRPKKSERRKKKKRQSSSSGNESRYRRQSSSADESKKKYYKRKSSSSSGESWKHDNERNSYTKKYSGVESVDDSSVVGSIELESRASA